MTRVKICGLSEVEHVLAAAEAGTDFVGFVFAESRRRVTAEQAVELVKAIGRLHQRPETVGVFADAKADEVNEIAERCHLDRVQLSGDETWQYCAHISRPVIKVLHVSQATTADQVLASIEEGRSILRGREFTCLLDSKIGKTHGGTGQTFDWKVAKRVASEFPIIVAGGLGPLNVAELVREAHPWGVDVSSGVETAGRKDPAKIRDFIEAVRRVA